MLVTDNLVVLDQCISFQKTIQKHTDHSLSFIICNCWNPNIQYTPRLKTTNRLEKYYLFELAKHAFVDQISAANRWEIITLESASIPAYSTLFLTVYVINCLDKIIMQFYLFNRCYNHHYRFIHFLFPFCLTMVPCIYKTQWLTVSNWFELYLQSAHTHMILEMC